MKGAAWSSCHVCFTWEDDVLPEGMRTFTIIVILTRDLSALKDVDNWTIGWSDLIDVWKLMLLRPILLTERSKYFFIFRWMGKHEVWPPNTSLCWFQVSFPPQRVSVGKALSSTYLRFGPDGRKHWRRKKHVHVLGKPTSGALWFEPLVADAAVPFLFDGPNTIDDSLSKCLSLSLSRRERHRSRHQVLTYIAEGCMLPYRGYSKI